MVTGDVQSLKRQLLGAGFWVVLCRIISIPLHLIVFAVIARLLDVASFGSYVLGYSLAMAGAMIGLFGFNRAIVRVVSAARAVEDLEGVRSAAVVGGAAALALSASACALIVSPLGIDLFSVLFGQALPRDGMVGIGLLLVSLALQTQASDTYRGLKDLRAASLLSGVLGNLVLLPVLAVCLAYDVSLTPKGLWLFQAAAIGLVAVGGWLRLFSRFGWRASPRRSELRSLLHVGLPMFAVGSTALLLQQADIWIAGALLAPEDVGLYGAASRTIAIVVTPLLLMNQIVPPFISELHERGEHGRLARLLRSSAALAALPSLALLVILLVAGRPLLALAFGPPYAAAWSILTILAAGRMVNVLTGSCNETLAMTGHQALLMRVTVFSGAATALAMLAGGWRYGAIGIAGAASLGQAMQNGISWLLVKRVCGIWTHADARSIVAFVRRLRSSLNSAASKSH